jgi:hypothetical protein
MSDIKISALPVGVATSSTPFPAVVAGVTDQVTLAPIYTDLAGKAATSHTHAQSDVTNLVSDLAGKVSASVLTPTLTPLDQSAWSWFNQGSATVNQASNVVFLSSPSAVGTNLRGRLSGSYPTPPFTLTVAVIPTFQVNSAGANFGVFGVTISDGTLHKILVAANFNFTTGAAPPALWVGNYNSVTSPASATVIANINSAGTGVLVWLRVVDNNTNQIFSYSFDGVNYVQILSESRITHLVPNNIGIVMTNQSGSQSIGGSFISWALS